MSDEVFDGMIDPDQALDQLSQKLGMPVTFKTRSQWRHYSRREADQIPLDSVLECRIDAIQVSVHDPYNLHLTAEFPSEAFSWIYTSHEMADLRENAGWSSDMHLEVLPTWRLPGYLLRLSRRLYPPGFQPGEEIGELGRIFFRVTSHSFEESPKLRLHSDTLSRHQNLIKIVEAVDELIFHVGGELFFISGVFCCGKLTKTCSPRKTDAESYWKFGHEVIISTDILEEI